MLLGQPEGVVGPVGAHFQRVQRQPQVVDRGGRRRQVIDEVDGLVDEVRVDDVDVEMDEVLAPDVLDVRERSGLQVVDADDAMAAGQQLIAQVRAEESGPARDDTRCHCRRNLHWRTDPGAVGQ